MRKNLWGKIVVFLVLFVSTFALTADKNLYKGKPVKYVFLFIGDGMGLPQVGATENYLGSKKSKDPVVEKLSFTQFPAQGITTTHDAGSFITDSASAVTAIASGQKTLNGVINMDPSKTKTFKPLSFYAKEKGMKIGIISSVPLNHATPAGFYAVAKSRNDYYEIALQLPESGFDYFGGGGFLEPTGKNKDKKSIFDIVKEKGYQLALNKEEMQKLKKGQKAIAISSELADSNAMKYEIDRKEGELALADFVKKGIELLDNPKGFFIMVEGGKIDWANHANDAVSSIHDVLALDRAVAVALEFAQKRPQETLIVVTGDHECGGMSIGYAATKYDTYFQKLSKQKVSYAVFDEILKKKIQNKEITSFESAMELITENFGLTLNEKEELGLNSWERKELENAFQHTMKLLTLSKEEQKDFWKNVENFVNYGGYEPLTIKITHILNRKAGIGWTSYAHTGVPVPTYAWGVGSRIFDGYYDNTDLFHKLMSIIGAKP